MWVTLSCTALVVAAIWLAALLLAIRDRYGATDAPPLVRSEPDALPVEVVVLTRRKRVLMVPLAILLGPVVILVVSILVVPLLLLQFRFLARHWLRFKLFGIPMPPVCPPEIA